MATSFLDSAAEFGVQSPETDYNEDIYAPVKLSSSTRRVSSVRDLSQSYANDNSLMAQVEQENEAKALELDKRYDEAYDRKISMRAKAAAWNDKVKAQEHGDAASREIVDLDPTQPDYLSKVDSVITKYPLAAQNPEIASVLEGRKAIYEETKKTLDAKQALLDRQQIRRENVEDNQKYQMDAARISRQSTLETKVADMSPEAQAKFDEVLKTETAEKAYREAKLVDRNNLTLKEANMANRMVTSYDSNIGRLRKEINAIDSDLLMEEEDKNRKKAVYEEELDRLTQAREMEQATVDAYWSTRGGRPKSNDNPSPTTETKPKQMSVKSLLPSNK